MRTTARRDGSAPASELPTVYLSERIESTEALDAIVRPLSKLAQRVLPQGRVKDALRGTWIGHPLHPALTDVPIGFWLTGVTLDLVGGKRSQRAADRCIALGLLFVPPTAAAGVTDWVDLTPKQQRTGVVHALSNVSAATLFGLSYVARKRGRRGRGVLLALAGSAFAGAGAFFGGHLSYHQGAGVNRNAFQFPPEEWTSVASFDDVPDGGRIVVKVGDVDVLLARRGDRLHAIANRCSHLGGPLHEGEFGDGTVTCPWHLSTFRLEDGRVVHGPATSPQQCFDARVSGGRVELRLAGNKS